MKPLLNKPVKASFLARHLSLQLRGEDLLITKATSLNEACESSLAFSKKPFSHPFDFPHVIFAPLDQKPTKNASVLLSKKPRLDFTKALILLEKHIGFKKHSSPPKIHPSVKIGKNVVIGNGVEIGENTIIYHNVVINDGVKIGSDCLIKSGAVIGEEGFGLERDDDGTPLRMMHFGNVIIGNRVEVGSLTTVCRATLSSTIIEDDAKIDDQVHVAHNCLIRKKVIVTATASISGSVEIKEQAWLAPNCTILQKKIIGEKSMVGIGATVMAPVPKEACMIGNPAKNFKIKTKIKS